MRKSIFTRLFASLLVTAAAVAGCEDASVHEGPIAKQALAVHDDGIFELDGNAVDNPAVAGADWGSLFTGASSALAFTGIVADPSPNSIFTGGGSKDDNNISSWRHRNGSVPDKDDLTDAYAAAYQQAGDLILYFGADRLDNSGDAQMGFWFFQNEVSANANGTFSGTHAVGDLLVLSNFSNGGAIGTIQVYKWVGSGGSAGALDLVASGSPGGSATSLFCNADDTLCAATNAGSIPSPWPYTPKSGPTGSFPTATFFEGGINLSDLVPSTTCISSFVAETRSSTSVSATLKDFVLHSFQTCDIEVEKECEVVSLNPVGSPKLFTATFNATVTNTGASALPVGTVITIVDDAGTPMDTSDDVTQSVTLTAPLASGASVPFSGTFQTDQNPPTNTIHATAQVGTAMITAQSSEQCDALELNPAIDVMKECSTVLETLNICTGSPLGIRVNISGQVCNTGDVPLQITSIVDSKVGSLPVPAAPLAPGACHQITGSYLPSSADGGVTNPADAMFSDTLTVTANHPAISAPVSDMATATCPLCPQPAAP